MNPARVAERGLLTDSVMAGSLSGYTLCFNKGGRHLGGDRGGHTANVGHANIEPTSASSSSATLSCDGRSSARINAPEGLVEGVLYRLSYPEEILKMDPFERAPWNYGRDVVSVATNEGDIWAWTYFANPAVKQDGLSPSREYLDHLLAGQAYLSAPYADKLRSWTVVE